MKIRLHHLTIAMLATAATIGTASANPRMGGGVYVPPPPAPRVGVPIHVPRPNIDVRSAVPTSVTGGTPSINSTRPGTSSERSSTFGPTGSPPPIQIKDVDPKAKYQVVTMMGPDGNPLIGSDGKPVKMEIKRARNPLQPKTVEDVLGLEAGKYPSGSYQPVDPKKPPTNDQDCGGHTVGELFGIPNARVDADTFYNGVIVGTKAPVVTSTGRGFDWTDVQKGDVVVFFRPGGAPGHIATVKDPSKGIITTKDGTERVREGQFGIGDDLHSSYGGEVRIYRVPPGVQPKVVTTASNTKGAKK
jgi:hypothetical protein